MPLRPIDTNQYLCPKHVADITLQSCTNSHRERKGGEIEKEGQQGQAGF